MSWLFPSERQGSITATAVISDTWAAGLLEIYGNFLQISLIFFVFQYSWRQVHMLTIMMGTDASENRGGRKQALVIKENSEGNLPSPP